MFILETVFYMKELLSLFQIQYLTCMNNCYYSRYSVLHVRYINVYCHHPKYSVLHLYAIL